MRTNSILKWVVSLTLPALVLVGCATTGAKKQATNLNAQTLKTIHLGLKTPNPSKCRFVKTLTVKFHNHWLKAHMTSRQLREDALRVLLKKAHQEDANYIHVRQISAETMDVFAYDFTSSVLVSGDAFSCHKMPKSAQTASAYLQKHDLKVRS